MTTVYYVDLEGSAGTGDGSSFANRAGTFADLGSASTFLADGDHEVRIKKSPTRSLGTGTVKRRGGWFRNGYDGYGMNSGTAYHDWSTTKGESSIRFDQHGLSTGDIVEIVGNRWYWNASTESNAYGDGSTNDQSGNYVGYNGTWTVTVVNDDRFKLDEWTAPYNKDTNTAFTGLNQGYHGKFYDATGCTVVFPANNPLPVKELMPESNRKKFTVVSGETSRAYTYDVWAQQENWSSSTRWTVPEGANRFYFEPATSQGLVAYYETPNTLDLSAYQGISFELTIGSTSNQTDWRPVSSTMHGRFSIRLCTDTAGATSVHTIPIDTRYVTKNTTRGHIDFDLGGNMNAAIKSIAIYKEFSGQHAGTFEFLISNLIAYKTAANEKLNHMSNIGLNTTLNPNWYTIKYIKTDGDHNFIRLATDGQYFYNAKDDYGYYGGGHSVGWEKNGTSLTTTGTVHLMQGFRVGTFNTPSANAGNNDNNQSYEGNFATKKFGSGTSTSPKLISGGWNATDMSTAGATDMTHLSNGFGSMYQGWYNSQTGGNYQTWRNIHFGLTPCYNSGSQYFRFENVQMDNSSQCYFTASHTRGVKDLRITMCGSNMSSLLHGTHVFSEVADGAAGLKVSRWGCAGQDAWNLGETPGFTWSEVKNEASPYIRFQNATYFANSTVQKLVTGMFGRSGQGVQIEYVQGFTINNWESIYNHMNISNNAEVTIGTMDFKRGSTATKHGTYPTSSASYSINWSSRKITLNGGTTDRKIQFYKSAKINNFVSTDSQEHTINEGNVVLSANHNGVSGAGKYLNYYWNIQPESTIRHTASGTAWKMTKTSSNASPVYELAKVAVAGSGTVTVKLWVYRTVSGTDTYALLRIPADATLGTSKSEMNSTNGAANTWYELTATATPTSAGILVVELELVDSTNSGIIYFDDMTITQT